MATSHVTSTAALPIGGFAVSLTDLGRGYAELCLSRVRPDGMSGVFTVHYKDAALPHAYYGELIAQYPFVYDYPENSAWDDRFAFSNDCLDHYDENYGRSISYFGDFNYDNAWDWDAITDPLLRAAYDDRYRPCNQP